ncbi:hypothetical protein LCN96_31970 [Nonomuraea gerenzanensis]|nr:hypothetical protein LCN96_31970 [Nonomuraea gerenzanensis]
MQEPRVGRSGQVEQLGAGVEVHDAQGHQVPVVGADVGREVEVLDAEALRQLGGGDAAGHPRPPPVREVREIPGAVQEEGPGREVGRAVLEQDRVPAQHEDLHGVVPDAVLAGGDGDLQPAELPGRIGRRVRPALDVEGDREELVAVLVEVVQVVLARRGAALGEHVAGGRVHDGQLVQHPVVGAEVVGDRDVLDGQALVQVGGGGAVRQPPRPGELGVPPVAGAALVEGPGREARRVLVEQEHLLAQPEDLQGVLGDAVVTGLDDEPQRADLGRQGR